MATHALFNKKSATTADGKITELSVTWFDATTKKPLVEFDGKSLPLQQIANMAAYGMAQCVQDSAAPFKTDFVKKLDAMRRRIASIVSGEYALNKRGAGLPDADVFDAAVAVKLLTDADRDGWAESTKSERAAVRVMGVVAAELTRRAKVESNKTSGPDVLAKIRARLAAANATRPDANQLAAPVADTEQK